MATIFGRCLIARVIYRKTFGGEFFSVRRLELHFLSLIIGKGIGDRVKIQSSGNGQSSDYLRRGHEGMGIGVPISTLGEVAVEGVDNSIFLLFFSPFSIPLANTRAASIGENFGVELLKHFHDAITDDSIANLF